MGRPRDLVGAVTETEQAKIHGALDAHVNECMRMLMLMSPGFQTPGSRQRLEAAANNCPLLIKKNGALVRGTFFV